MVLWKGLSRLKERRPTYRLDEALLGCSNQSLHFIISSSYLAVALQEEASAAGQPGEVVLIVPRTSIKTDLMGEESLECTPVSINGSIYGTAVQH